MADSLDLNSYILLGSAKDISPALELLRSRNIFSKVFPGIPRKGEGPGITIGVEASQLDLCIGLLENSDIEILGAAKLPNDVLRSFYEDTGN